MKTLALLIALMALWGIQAVQAGEFFCQSGDVTCLISAIDNANNEGGEDTITLEPGIYTLQAISNGVVGSANGLPVIRSAIHIQVSADDQPTIIERDPNASDFRIFQVSPSGNLSLTGLTVQGGRVDFNAIGGAAILNEQGKVSLYDSVIRDNFAEGAGAIVNVGTLNLFRTIITGNRAGFETGGILNGEGGTALIEFSTIAFNIAQSSGGILNHGAMVVRNSSIISNGGGLFGVGGIDNRQRFTNAPIPFLEIINSTIALNRGGQGGGGGIRNGGGQVSIISSTIRENDTFLGEGGGIANLVPSSIPIPTGSVRLQNTIVAGNTSSISIGNPTVGNSVSECLGTITSLGNNLIGDPSSCDVNLQSTDLTGEPGLDALAEEDSPGRAYYPVLGGSIVLNSGNAAACPSTDQLGNPRVGNCDIGAIESQDKLPVYMDVRPRSDANKINPKSTKTINVAIFSGNGFDATTIDPNTVRFGTTGTEAAPIHVSRRDVNVDGDPDMVLRFQIQDTQISCGDTSALLTGQIAGVAIIGSSPIKTVQCKQKQPKIAVKLK